MPEPLIMKITLAKEVETQEAAQALWELVLAWAADKPNLKVAGHCTTSFRKEPTP